MGKYYGYGETREHIHTALRTLTREGELPAFTARDTSDVWDPDYVAGRIADAIPPFDERFGWPKLAEYRDVVAPVLRFLASVWVWLAAVVWSVFIVDTLTQWTGMLPSSGGKVLIAMILGVLLWRPIVRWPWGDVR